MQIFWLYNREHYGALKSKQSAVNYYELRHKAIIHVYSPTTNVHNRDVLDKENDSERETDVLPVLSDLTLDLRENHN